MAQDKSIEQLIAATFLNLTDDGVVVQNGITKKTSVALYVALLQGLIQAGSVITYGTTIPNGGKTTDVYLKTDTGQFFQNNAGTWGVFYTIPNNPNSTAFRYAVGAPANTLGINGDSYIDTNSGIFYQKVSGSYVQEFSMATGPQGPRGNSVLNGTTDPTGGIGVNGDFYINTSTETIFGPKSGGSWGTGTLLLIVPNTIITGNTAPSNTQGNNGDYYLNPTNFLFYGPKASGVWPTAVSIIGPSGTSAPLPEVVKISAGTASPFSISMNIARVDIPSQNRTVFGDRPTVIRATAPGFPLSGLTGTQSQAYDEIIIIYLYTNANNTGLTNIYVQTKDISGNFDADTYITLKA